MVYSGTKLEHLDPELQTIHDNIVAKAETKKKKTLEGTSVGKRLEGVGTDEDELPQKATTLAPYHMEEQEGTLLES